MNDIVKTAPGGALAAGLADRLRAGITQSRASTPLSGGKPFLRLLTDGEWVYGQEDMDIQEGSRWAVNVLSIQHGYSCWSNYDKKDKKKNELLGETMAPIHEDKPTRPGPINGFEYKDQRLFELKCLNGEDTGTEVQYKTSSVGGMRAVDGLLSDIVLQLGENPAFPCPVIELKTDHYKHSSYGKTYVPVFDLVGWCDINGNMSDQASGNGEPSGRLPDFVTGGKEGQRQRRAAVADGGAATAADAATAPAAEAPKRTRKRAEPAAATAPAYTPEPEPAPEPQENEEADDTPFEGGQPARSGMPRRRPGVRA